MKDVMTRTATNLSEMMAARQAPVKERVWWSNSWESTTMLPDQAFFSPVLPIGTLITEVQIQARPVIMTTVTEGLMFLRIVGTGDLTNQQVYDSEPLIKWARTEPRWDWGSFDLFTNERWPCYQLIHGANQRIAWFSQATDAKGMRIRVSVQYQLP